MPILDRDGAYVPTLKEHDSILADIIKTQLAISRAPEEARILARAYADRRWSMEPSKRHLFLLYAGVEKAHVSN